MQTVELFCGTKSFSTIAASFGYATFTIDNDASHAPDMLADIRLLSPSQLPASPVVLWASPPCQTFSVLGIPAHWNRDGSPRTLSGHRLVAKTLGLLIELKPRWWFIENPRGMLRTVSWFENSVRDLGGSRHTITYCQYGDTRQKPTDIWTNAHWWKSKMACAPGAPCHEFVGRAFAKRGTLALSSAKERSKIPPGLFQEIFTQLTEHTHDDA